ncbi:hypothetical protein MAR_000400 [Mya arenaria]|uniref:Uncharacterized protein n=1 Tax=Mya arenaria TaxID=6604 RepID=A0ABY7F8N9_MYAAR|nr:hypothetical protein MAR_000400 [Mya arenaria]
MSEGCYGADFGNFLDTSIATESTTSSGQDKYLSTAALISAKGSELEAACKTSQTPLLPPTISMVFHDLVHACFTQGIFLLLKPVEHVAVRDEVVAQLSNVTNALKNGIIRSPCPKATRSMLFKGPKNRRLHMRFPTCLPLVFPGNALLSTTRSRICSLAKPTFEFTPTLVIRLSLPGTKSAGDVTITLEQLSLGHDGRGHRAGFFVEMVVVTERSEDKSHIRHVFQCGPWLDSHNDNCHMETMLRMIGVRCTKEEIEVIIHKEFQSYRKDIPK